MSYAEKVVEIMKTRKGKLFTLLLVLTVIFTFTGIAYGTSESGKDLEDQIVQTEEPSDETAQDQSSEEALEDEATSDDNESTLSDQAVDDELGEEGEEDAEETAPVPTVLINGVVDFKVEGSDQTQILYDGDIVTRAIEVDPQGVSAANPFVFGIVAAQGYEVESVSLTSVFNDRAKPSVPAALLDSEEAVETEKSLMGGGLPYEDLSDELKAALDDTSDKTVDVVELSNRASADSDNASLLYSLEDMTLFAGRDVTITIKTKEVQYDAWYKVVDALAAGNSVKLTHDLVAGEDPQIEGATPEQIERNKQPAVVKEGSNVTLDLNGHSIESKINGSDALISATGTGTTLTITDPNSAPIYGGKGTLQAPADEAGRLATWDNASRTLTYYVTDTLALGESSVETCLVETVKAPDNAGMISGGSSTLVAGTNGSTINIKGGIFNVNAKAINVAGSTFEMTGGYIVGCSVTGDNGAAINAANSAVTIAGSAVIAGNKVEAPNAGAYTGGNGGGIALFATEGSMEATVGGKAIIAGNIAKCANTTDAYNRPTNGLGGGIYTKSTKGSMTLNIGGDAVISGNTASFDGGGIYHMQGKLNLGGSAYITNNVAEKGQEIAESNGSAYPVHYGGGGIFSLDLVNINGAVKVTSNKAGGSGGGLLMASQGNQVTAVLKMDSGYFAGNLAITNEGGAMCLTTKGADKNGSYIYSGYITNNKTMTSVDYGGGGVFVTSNGGELYVYNPLVTSNTAEGSGGGVAACQNGIVISSDAAIFDNIANGKSVPVNHPIGGQWPSELGFAQAENYVDGKYAASDFYGAKESTIFNDMLSTGEGVGTYNWKGFMSGSGYRYVMEANALSANQSFVIKKSKDDSTVLSGILKGAWIPDGRDIAGLTVDGAIFGGMNDDEAKALLDDIFKNGMLVKIGSEYKSLTAKYDDNFADDPYRNAYVHNNDGTWTISTYIESIEYGEYKYGGNLYNADGSVNTSGWERFGDIDITTSTDSGKYEIFKIKDFPINKEINGEMKAGYAEATRMMGLTAFPSEDDKKNAKAAARLIISGNYSAANGGGIAVNGKTTIGRDPKYPDEPGPDPEPKFGSLNINKMFDNAIEQDKAGKATVLFKVSGYLNEHYYHADPANPYYSDIIEINFDVDENGKIDTNSVLLDNLPVGAFFVIEEIVDFGFNTEAVGDTVKTITIVAGDNGTVNNVVEFHNVYDPDKPYNDSIQNDWSKNMTKPDDQGGEGNGSGTPDEE